VSTNAVQDIAAEETRKFQIAGDDLFPNPQQETLANRYLREPLSSDRVGLVAA
jgi:hypothetical protein